MKLSQNVCLDEIWDKFENGHVGSKTRSPVLYKDNHVHACVCAFVNFFFKKTSPQKLLTGLLPNFIVVFLR